jgi:hypothetical protein
MTVWGCCRDCSWFEPKGRTCGRPAIGIENFAKCEHFKEFGEHERESKEAVKK